MRRKLAVVIGINAYPTAPLRGCVNDAHDWSSLLRSEGYELVALLLDSQATKAAMLGAMQSAIGQAGFGDRVVITYSGHGTWTPDRDGDEIDGRDEALVPFDYQSGLLITDDELHTLYQTRRRGVRVTMVSDSCHSGTMQRFIGGGSLGSPRFLPPSDLDLLTEAQAVEAEERIVRTTPSRPSSVLLSGCADAEVSYDAYIGGKPCGALTSAAMATYRKSISWALWHRAIRAALPSAEYPQTPQLQASKSMRYGPAL